VTRHAYGQLPDQYATLRGDGPTIVVLHGGFWRAKYKAGIMDPLCDALAALGFAAWNVEYRRVGTGGGYPETLEDVASACRAAPDPVLALGHSAGGHLALWAAAEGLVPAALSLGGVSCLAGAARAGVGNGAVLDLMGGGPDELPEAYAHADPVQRLPFPAEVTLVHGTDDDDVPVEQSRTFADASGCTFVELPATGHMELIEPGSLAWQRIAATLPA
jgi:dipeptidyl aminopeptidase/acylaminoacyl peptidase